MKESESPTPGAQSGRTEARSLRVLMIGALFPTISGTTILFRQLIEDLERRGVTVRTVDLSGIRGGGMRGAVRFCRAVGRIFCDAGASDVLAMHLNPSALPVIGPCVWAAARLWRRPYLVRIFGGMGYAKMKGLVGRLALAVVRRADGCLVETKALVSAAQADGVLRAAWFANSRPVPPALDVSTARRTCRSFIFLGRVCPEKGIREIIAAGERFGEQVRVDVYGPFWRGDIGPDSFAGLKRVRYCGSVPPEKAEEVLRQYDALLLPTYHTGEGYPGIIIEAYGVGMPVICTRWMALPEIVDGESGIMVEPRDAEALYAAMKTLVDDESRYRRLCQGARAKAGEFAIPVWTDRFEALCREAMERRAHARD